MADLLSTAGMKLYIGGTQARKSTPHVEGDFTGETWVLIDGWQQVGSYGDSAQVITTSLVNTSRDVKQKGTSNAGSMENTFAWIPDDAGQLALKAAAAPTNKSNYAFKVEHSDTEGNTTPSIDYFIGLVTSFSSSGGDANTVRSISAQIEINSNIVSVDAVAAP